MRSRHGTANAKAAEWRMVSSPDHEAAGRWIASRCLFALDQKAVAVRVRDIFGCMRTRGRTGAGLAGFGLQLTCRAVGVMDLHRTIIERIGDKGKRVGMLLVGHALLPS